MRRAPRWDGLYLIGLLLMSAGCMEPLEPSTAQPVGEELGVGQTRSLELSALRFDVLGFEQTVTREDLLALPQDIQEQMWLLDLDLSNSLNSPHLLDNALLAIRDLDPATLPPAAANMQRLINMTPDTANLEGTAFEELTALSPLLGVAPARVLADLFEIDVEEPFLTTDAVTRAILTQVIGSHPNAQMRRGPVTAEHPDGLYAVAPESLPITLADAASDFATLSDRFGPVFVDGVYHPGFIVGDVRSLVLGEDFRMTVRANANALPYKGLDLSVGEVASVNSVASQVETLFDFDDPNWLVVEGLVEGIPTIESMTFRIVEADEFVPGGRVPTPAPYGGSQVWRLPAWSLERVVAESALSSFSDLASHIEYVLPGRDTAALSAHVEGGWVEIETAAGLGSPPPPAYAWDLLLEVAQVRLHDGGLIEGDADVEFTLTDIPIGVDTETIQRTITENLRANPAALVDVAAVLLDSSSGAADFYYYRVRESNPSDAPGDYLFFVTEDDIALDDDGLPVRPYTYGNPGFFADEALTDRLSSSFELNGDVVHEKVQVFSGDVLYLEDDLGWVFRLAIGDKPSENRLHVDVTRVR